MGDLEPHRDAGALFRVDLLLQHGVEEVEIRRLGARRVIEHGVEPLGHVAEPQAGELIGDARVHHRAHRAPPIASAYASSERPRGASGTMSLALVFVIGAARQRPATCAGSSTWAYGSRTRRWVATSVVP